ncbi:LTA synthase family protein [Shouchella clausii]|uniref:Phosphoglycerol transferase n=1 Tax=Shouchella clausii (strain KSM-K16) TaxID=66692 RepID=Q5WCT4_SHOC1|nr:LTA synthase family protein [Shouchella clausii]KKI87054.1 phosphoglycerol transferase [Shouchella clausii]PAD46112.1 phosphoglycerol transferase [Shouchella clausii]PAE83348.1 phosphoglycerol transferase [Shouchella clausii]BAD65826.1 phosphoglycerol transferase [Shouchella clausii KSM-K16]
MNELKHFLAKHLIPLGVVVLWLKTVIVSATAFSLPIQNGADVFLLLIGPLGSLMLLLGFSFYFSKHVRPLVFLLVYLLCTALLFGTLLYYRFYIDFLTVSVFLQFSNVGGLGSSTAELVSPYDLLLLIDLFVVAWFTISAKIERRSIERPRGKGFAWSGLVTLVVALGVSHIQNPYLLKTDYARDELVASLGLYNYQLVNLAQGISAPLKESWANEATASDIQAEMQEKPSPDVDVFGLAQGKNIVMISLESTQNFVIGQTVNGEELTPFLNQLIEESFYFPNIYDQTAQGKSSDMEFMLDTGFYPLSSGSAFVRRYENTFRSLPQILKEQGYTSAAFHANDATFWNREAMYETLGYDEFFSKDDYEVTDELSVNYGLKDKPFFAQSVDHLNTLESPYMAKFIPLTNHFPFLLEQEDQSIDPADTGVDVVNRYVTTIRYQDEAIEQFFADLKKEGHYEDTIFLLYGDHYGISRQYESGVHTLLDQEENTLTHLDLQKVPLIIHIPGQTGQTIETEGGQIDIHATLLQLLGLSANENLTFSYDLFTRPSDVPIIFRDGRFVSEEYLYADHTCYDRKTEQPVEETYCAKDQEIVREQLSLSDEILLGDLLRFLD